MDYKPIKMDLSSLIMAWKFENMSSLITKKNYVQDTYFNQ